MLRQVCLRLAILAACAASGCISPVDTDTPRHRFVDGTVLPPVEQPARIKAKNVTITARDVHTQTDWKILPGDTLVEIDTSVHPPVVWIQARIGREHHPTSPATPFVQEYRLRIDSLAADNALVSIVGEPASPSGAAFKLAAERDSSGSARFVSLTANAEKNLASFRLESPGTQGYLTGILNINLVAHRVQVESKLTIRY